MPGKPHRYWLAATILLGFSVANAQEKIELPPDLIELLGELDEDDQAILETTMKDIENKSAPKPQSKAEVGAKK